LLAMTLVLTLGAWAGWGRRPPPPPSPPPVEADKPFATMEALSLTEIQEGDKRWVLAGQKANFHKDRMEVSIQGVQVDFYRQPGEHLRVKAQEGLLNTKTRILTLKGQVELESGETVVKTSRATYLPAERALVAPEEVILENPRVRVQGKDLRVELATRKMTLARHQKTEVKALAWKPRS